MTALSIPERARKIADRLCTLVASHGESRQQTMSREIEKVLHSERELCAKELDSVVTDSLGASAAFAYAAKILRDGGK